MTQVVQNARVLLKEGSEYDSMVLKVQGEGLARPSPHGFDHVEGDTFK
jgi:hypothetical protein